MAKPKLGSSSFSQNNTHYDHFIHLEYDDSLLLEFALVMELHFVPIFVRVINTILINSHVLLLKVTSLNGKIYE
jgi:hypothetical protein